MAKTSAAKKQAAPKSKKLGEWPSWWPSRLGRLGILPPTKEEMAEPGWMDKRRARIHEVVEAARLRAIEEERERQMRYLATKPSCPGCGQTLIELPCDRCRRLRRASFTMAPGGVYRLAENSEPDIVELDDQEAAECAFIHEVVFIDGSVCAKFKHPDGEDIYAQPVDPDSV